MISALATKLRYVAASTVRSMPRVRGRGRLGFALNSAFLAIGADPRALAKASAGHKLFVDTRVHAHARLLFTGDFEEPYVQALLQFLRPGGTAADVGANVGFVTVPLALAAERLGGSVVAFEPFQGNAAWLRENLELNDVTERVTLVVAGLSSSKHSSQLSLTDDFKTGARVGNAIVDEAGQYTECEKVSIQLETLDEYWPTIKNPRLDIIKVDIEGHEGEFLDGGRETIAAHRPVILMEVNRYYYRNRGEQFEEVIPARVPEGYRFYNDSLKPVEDLWAHRDNDVLLIPIEKVPSLARVP